MKTFMAITEKSPYNVGNNTTCINLTPNLIATVNVIQLTPYVIPTTNVIKNYTNRSIHLISLLRQKNLLHVIYSFVFAVVSKNTYANM